MTALCEMATVDEVRIHIKAAQTISLNVSSDLMEMQLFSSSGGLIGKIKDILFAKWNEGALPIQAGQHDNTVFVANPVKIYYAASLIDCEVFAHLRIGVERYYGELSDAQAAMLKGEGPQVNLPSIEEGWRKVEADEQVDPEITFEGVRSY